VVKNAFLVLTCTNAYNSELPGLENRLLDDGHPIFWMSLGRISNRAHVDKYREIVVRVEEKGYAIKILRDLPKFQLGWGAIYIP
jgi:hypothetical protein